MMSRSLASVAENLVVDGKGILAADETVPTLTKRFDTLGIKSTEQSRRTYREMLFSSPGAAEFISGAIMYDETIRQKSPSGTPLAKMLTSRGILPGIKVDTAQNPLLALRKRPSLRGSTDYEIASKHTAIWEPVSQSGGPSSMSPRLYRAPPA